MTENTLSSDAKYRLADDLYDEGASLMRIVREVGTDTESLQIISSRLGVAMSTLRRQADEITALEER